MKKLLTLSALACSVIAPTAMAAEEVNVYSYRQPFLVEPMFKEFTKETGIKVNVKFAKKGLAEKLAQVQPSRRSEFQRRATEFATHVLKIDAEMIALFAPYKGRGVVADHHGVELFLRRYGLRYVGSLQSANHSSLSLKQVRRLRKEVRLKNAECVVLSEPHAGTDLLQIFSGLEIATAQVDILGEQADSYGQLIRQLGESIASCLNKE